MAITKEEKEAAEQLKRALEHLRVSYTTDGNHQVVAYLSQRGKEWIQELEKFMKSNYAGESIHFLNAVRELLDGKNLKHKIPKLIDTYIKENSTEQINISSSARNDIIAKLKQIEEEKKDYHLSDFQAVFVKAIDQITQLIDMDSGIRFIVNPKIAADIKSEKKQFTAIEAKLNELKNALKALDVQASPELKKSHQIDLPPKARQLLGIEGRLSQLKKKVADLDLQFSSLPKKYEDELKVLQKEAKAILNEFQKASKAAKQTRPPSLLIFTRSPSTPTQRDTDSSTSEPSSSSTPKTPSSKSSK